MTSHFNVIVLGQGLAGTSLAWSLRWSGQTVLVIDREALVTPSKIAAGLVTPITGQKLTKTWRHAELWPSAISFYRQVEAETGIQFFRELSMVRLFANEVEVATFERRRGQGEFGDLVRPDNPQMDEEWFNTELGGFEMASAGQLDVARFLQTSRETFRQGGGYLAADVDVSRDIVLIEEGVRLTKLDVTAQRLVFCQGLDALDNPWFREIEFKPAKGEILTLRIPGLKEGRVVHRGIWLAPVGGDVFKAGSTYEWQRLDNCPTSHGRDEIIRGLRQFLRLPFEIISHAAAVRPIHRNQYPVMGIHPIHTQLGYVNGLGSKGSLHAPFFTRQFAHALVNAGMIDPDVDLAFKTTRHSSGRDNSGVCPPAAPAKFGAGQCHVKHGPPQTSSHAPIGPADPRKSTRRPLTQQAQDAIRAVLKPGEIAIDATAGNGHDTQFLAACTGPTGTVYAFDIQPLALEKTAKRLADAGLVDAVLINRDHSQMSELIPDQHHGQIAVVMFNLGYLPGGDKSVTTNHDSTRSAIVQSTLLLRSKGMLTVLAYTGHDGGKAEADMVADVLDKLSKSEFVVSTIESQPGRTAGPRLFLVKRTGASFERSD